MDFILFKKTRSASEICCLFIVSAGVFEFSLEEQVASWIVDISHLSRLARVLGTAAAINKLCGTTACPQQVAHQFAPWGAIFCKHLVAHRSSASSFCCRKQIFKVKGELVSFFIVAFTELLSRRVG